jgi:hypothetical protein
MGSYSFLDNTLSITGPGGSFTIGGQGAQNAKEGYDIEFKDDKNIQQIGADGAAQNALNASSAATLTVRLLKTSPVNAQLSSLYNTQAATSSLWGQNIITHQNKVLGDGYTMTEAAFKKFPKNVNDTEGGMNEWVFDVGICAPSLGGGGTVASSAALVQQSV